MTILGAGVDTELFKAPAEKDSNTPIILFAEQIKPPLTYPKSLIKLDLIFKRDHSWRVRC